MSNWKLLVGEDDNICWWAGMQRYMDKYNLRWIDNYEFEDTLKYSGYSRGNSSCTVQFKSINDNKEYTMFMKELDDCIDKLIEGKLTGKFTFCKCGQNYGIKYLG